MLLRIGKIAVLLAVVAGLTLWIHSLRAYHIRLERVAVDLRRKHEQAVRQRDEDQRLQGLIARAKAGEVAAREKVHADLLLARAEVAALEKHAAEQRTEMLTRAAANAEGLDHNRDPEKGMTRLEYFQNVGRATPSAAVQTLIWAAMKGDDSLPGMFAVNGAARTEAEAVIASLPANEQSEYSTPEKLAALVFSDMILKQTAAQIVGVTASTSSDATVSIAGNEAGKANVPMQLTADGWQLSISAHQFDSIANRLKIPSGR